MSYQHFINGQWTDGAATNRINVDDPATQNIIADIPAGTAQDAHAAVAAAKAAFTSWRKIGATERAHLLHEVSHKVHAHWDELVHSLTLEQGKPVPEQAEELEWTADTFDYYAELSRNSRGRVIPSNDDQQFNFVVKEPYGVVACIIPWNYPMLLLAWKLAPALAAGNTAVIKPSEMTPLTTSIFVEKCLDHLPAGVVNLVHGYGLDVAEPLVRHRDVPVIAFTGSLATGQRIASIAAPMMKKLHLELGGKDAFVVAPDVDIEKSAKALAYSALTNCGQVCTSTERVYVAREILPQFTEAVVAEVKSLKIGAGIDPQTDLGPMIGDLYRAKFELHVEDARLKGANILTGGKRPPQYDRGYFYEPTVFANVTPDMLIVAEEIIARGIPLMPYNTFDEAIELANSSEYGLGAVLRTNDPKLAKKFFEEVKAGTIWINDPLTDNYAGPFGGMKMSGGARELGEEGLEVFRETKHVHWDFSDDTKPFWFPYGK